MEYNGLKIGELSENGQVEIFDQDRLCYKVISRSKGAYGVRTISKCLLEEFYKLYIERPNITANEARDLLSGKSDIDKFEYGYASTIWQMAKMLDVNRKNSKSGALPNEQYSYKPIAYQIIYYGAPGTGKSHSVKCETEAWEKKERVVRTTFHPDSDYSTFVGAYKPTTDSVQRYDIYNKPITKDGKPVVEQVITYEFVAQAFLQAYINAWKNREEPEFLIIEEINRGNCAQIFGDLFQLLDRGDNGYSEYSVRADKDLQKHLAKAFADVVLDDYPKVKSGEVLILPNNLYIRATMNTSDQSLFPIDSAFKRRWDWKYVPIAKGKDNNGCDLDWKIEIDGESYDWWTFVETINKYVYGTTDSADKQLGFFFCKAKNNIIDAETFVGKVIFYLWNDVFKDYGFDNPIFADKDGIANSKLSFDKFYTETGEINKDKVKIFLANLEEDAKIGFKTNNSGN